MKKAMLPLLTFTLLIGCKKTGPVSKPTSSYFISATTSSGKTFSAASSQINVSGATGENTKIDGYVSTSAELEFRFTAYPSTTGTFYIDGTNISGIYYDRTIPKDTLGYAAHGSITFTALSPDAVGTFVFTREDSVVVTGSFDVPKPL